MTQSNFLVSIWDVVSNFFGEIFEDEYQLQYVIHDDRLSWSDAMAACEADGMTLAVVKN